MICLFCRKEISNTAIRCKHCRNILSPSSEALANKETSPWGLHDVIFLYCKGFILTMLLEVFVIPIALFFPIDYENDSILSLIQIAGTYTSTFLMLWVIYRYLKKSYRIPILEALKFGPLKLGRILIYSLAGFSLAIMGQLVSHHVLDLHTSSSVAWKPTAWSLGPYVFLICTVGPFYEETLFRGLIYPALNKKLGMGAATLLTTVLFSLFHLFGRNSMTDAFAYYLLFTYLLTWVRAKMDSTTGSFIMHVTFNMTLVGLSLVGLKFVR